MSQSLYFGQVVIGPAGSGKVTHKSSLPFLNNLYSPHIVNSYKNMPKSLEEISLLLISILLLKSLTTDAT